VKRQDRLLQDGLGKDMRLWIVKYCLKLFFYSLLAVSGFYSLWGLFRRESIVILTIHGVMDKGCDAEWEPTRPQISSKHLEHSLKLTLKYCKFISLDEAVDMLSGNIQFQRNCVVLTFDDGYRNNLTHAWPVLVKLKVPAIVFPAVGHIEKRECFWFDRLDYAIQQHAAAGGRYCALGDERIEIDSTNRKSLRKSIKTVIFKIKELSGSDDEVMAIAEKTISQLEAAYGKSLNTMIESDAWCGVMSWDDLKLARERGMDIGSHTVDHARVGLLDEAAVRWQLSESKRIIEEKLQQECKYFCYPNGDYSEAVIPQVREAGYKAALTTKEGLNYRGDDLYTLKRMHMPQLRSPQEVLGVATGFTFQLSLLLRGFRKSLRGMGVGRSV
jgi:peptidoglycan/xylan/chitin deacetylase (PgdA/CDA1 family)